MAVGPDVHRAHEEDTERYVLTNLNMVSTPRACADRSRGRGGGSGTPGRSGPRGACG